MDIVAKLPLPPGTFPTLWNADDPYKENYMSNYEGYYQTYDAGHIDDDGYIWIMSRTDDIINVVVTDYLQVLLKKFYQNINLLQNVQYLELKIN